MWLKENVHNPPGLQSKDVAARTLVVEKEAVVVVEARLGCLCRGLELEPRAFINSHTPLSPIPTFFTLKAWSLVLVSRTAAICSAPASPTSTSSKRMLS